MKFKFTLTISGKESILTKFEKKMADHSRMNMYLMHGMALSIMNNLHLDDSDEVIIEKFLVEQNFHDENNSENEEKKGDS